MATLILQMSRSGLWPVTIVSISFELLNTLFSLLEEAVLVTEFVSALMVAVALFDLIILLLYFPDANAVFVTEPA